MLILLAIGVFVFLILAYIVPDLIGKGSKQTSDILSSSKDYDNDGIADYFDKCPCDKENKDVCTTPKEECKDILNGVYT